MKNKFLLLLLLTCFTAHGQEVLRKSYKLPKWFAMKWPTERSYAVDTTFRQADILYTEHKRAATALRKARLYFITAKGAWELTQGTFTDNGTRITIVAGPGGAKLKKYQIVLLQQDVEVKYADLTPSQRADLKLAYRSGDAVQVTTETALPTGKVTKTTQVVADNELSFLNEMKVRRTVAATQEIATRGYMKFEEDKIWVNPHFHNYKSSLFYYKLANRQTISLHFHDFTISALTIPLRYRFPSTKRNGKRVEQDFGTAINLNGFAGGTVWGKTSFHYREKVSNMSNTFKLTLGGIIGTSSITLDKGNTSAADEPITDDTKLTKGLLMLGGGGVFSFNKINLGAFMGWDFAVGNNAARWNYNRQPWVGLAVGYSIIPF